MDKIVKHEYILDNDYFSAEGRFYRRGEKITLDENHSAVKLCLPLGSPMPDDIEEEVVIEKSSKKAKKAKMSDMF
jgi:hypothetical protein